MTPLDNSPCSRRSAEFKDADKQREHSASPPTSEKPFCVAELQRSLQEQSFGIKNFTMTSTSEPATATASVVLVEGQTVVIQLTLQGYSVIDSSDINAVEYETLEDLLQVLSPLYTTKRQEAIATALARLT